VQIENIREGLWAVLRIKNGIRWVWLMEKPDDLKKAAILTLLEPYRAEIGRQLAKLYEEKEEKEYSIYDLITIMFDVVATGKRDD